ncbi:MAG: hypothetical protein SGILL_002844 [Bacillariaceae sp.]
MPQERVDRLNALGFLWTVTAAAASGENTTNNTNSRIKSKLMPGLQKEGIWNEKYKQLKTVCDGIFLELKAVQQQPTQDPTGNVVPENDVVEDEDRKPAAVMDTNVEGSSATATTRTTSPVPFATGYHAWTVVKERHSPLFKWLQQQRNKRSAGKLSKSCTQKLHDAFCHSAIWTVEPAWLKFFHLLQAYNTQHGSCKVLCYKPTGMSPHNPSTIVTTAGKGVPKKHRALYEWVQTQRSFENLVAAQSALAMDTANKNTNLSLEQAEWLQAIPGWSWETSDDGIVDDDEEFGAYFLQLKRLQANQQLRAQGEQQRSSSKKKKKKTKSTVLKGGMTITHSDAPTKIVVRKGGKLGKFVQLQRRLYKEQYANGHTVSAAITGVKGMESLAAAAETVEAAAVVGDKRKDPPPTAEDINAIADSVLDASRPPPTKKARTNGDTASNDMEATAAANSSVGEEDGNKTATGCRKNARSPKLVLTKRKVHLLDSLGFSWTPTNVQHSWEDMFEQLKAYKNEHGDCLVAKRYKRNPKLGQWVGKQRDRYKKMLALQSKGDSAETKKSQKNYWDIVTPLTQPQLESLNDVGFVWQANNIKGDWQRMFEKLKEYKAENGTCNVSQKATGEIGRLGRWVKTQREKYHRSKAELAPLTEEQTKQLESIGFEWRPGGTKTHEETWQCMYDELKSFRDEHGSCKVPQKYGKLGGWVDRQRKRYKATLQARAFMSNPANQGQGLKPPSLLHNTIMTDDQIQALNEIGFLWQLRERSKVDTVPGGMEIVAGHQEYIPLNANDIPMDDDNPYHHHHHLHPPHAMQQQQFYAHPHHHQGMMPNSAPEDEAATRSLLYFQGGGGGAAGVAGGGANPGMGYGMQGQYDYGLQQQQVAYANNNGNNYAPNNAGQNGNENTMQQQHHHGGNQDHEFAQHQQQQNGYSPNNSMPVYDGVQFHSQNV